MLEITITFFFFGGFGIILPTMVDMPFNKESKHPRFCIYFEIYQNDGMPTNCWKMNNVDKTFSFVVPPNLFIYNRLTSNFAKKNFCIEHIHYNSNIIINIQLKFRVRVTLTKRL